jgi:hypothetical protein
LKGQAYKKNTTMELKSKKAIPMWNSILRTRRTINGITVYPHPKFLTAISAQESINNINKANDRTRTKQSGKCFYGRNTMLETIGPYLTPTLNL